MNIKFLKFGLSRRRFRETAAGAAAVAGLGRGGLAAEKVVKIVFLAPLTGPVAAWGKPGLDGCTIWGEQVNAAGGVRLADGNYMIEFIGYDNEYDPAKTRTGATKPGLKTYVICAQDDALGLPSVATYLAAFEAAGIELIEKPLLFDPALNAEGINFKDPNGFFAEYNKRHPGEWGAVSWEYASIMDLWKEAAEEAGSAEPDAVTYQENMRTRMRAIATETAETLAAFERGEASPHRFYERWRGEKPSVFDDTRKFLAAALMIGTAETSPSQLEG